MYLFWVSIYLFSLFCLMVDVEGVEVLLKKIKVNLNNDIKGIYL